jgi:hypothetical protein
MKGDAWIFSVVRLQPPPKKRSNTFARETKGGDVDLPFLIYGLFLTESPGDPPDAFFN